MNQWTKDFISGSVSGMFGIFVGHPLDTVKCRIQVNSKVYSSAYNSIKKILIEERILGLFKGVLPPMMSQFPINAMYLFLNKTIFRVLQNDENIEGD